MNRHFVWAMLLAAGTLFGGVWGAQQTNSARAQVPDAEEEQQTTALDEMREIKAQLKEINSLLHSGTVKVVVVLNPDAGR